jgi:hypothetical protein
MRVDFAVVCDYALVDQYGKLSVLGIFQHIWVARFPSVHPRLHLVLRLRGKRTEVGEHRIDIRFVNDADVEVLQGNGSVTFAEPPAGVLELEAGAVLAFDVPLATAGHYRFEVTIDGELAATVPVTVAQSQGPRPPNQPSSAGSLH